MPTLASHCPLDCPDACSLDVQVQEGHVISLDGGTTNPLTEGYICSKVRKLTNHLYGPDRLLRPAIRVGPKGQGNFRDISWDEALALVADRMCKEKSANGGETILPLSYGGSNGYLTQDTTDARLFRRLGASRLARTVCAVPTAAANQGLYGRWPGVEFSDYQHARLIVVWGCNPAATGIHLVPHLDRARRCGAQLVVVDPRRTSIAARADLHLSVRPGGDLPLALALIRWFFENDVADLDFLREHATGVDELRARAAVWDPDSAAQTSGVPADKIVELARMYADASPAIIRCGWGLERNRNGGSAVAAVLALPAVAGKFGVRGGGYTLSNSGAWRLRSEAAAAEPDIETRVINMNHVGRTLTGETSPPVNLLFVYNCNPLMTLPNQELIRLGLEREDLFTVVFDAVHTDTARYADVLLPATVFLEHAELSAGYGSMVLQHADAIASPPGEARPNYDVFTDLCHLTGVARSGDPEGAEMLVKAILSDDTDDGSARRLAASLTATGSAFPNSGYAPVQFGDLMPFTADQKIHLCPAELDEEAPVGLYGYCPDPATEEHPLALVSPATSFTLSSTFGQLRRKLVPVEIHPNDATTREITDGDNVRVFNDLGEVRCPAHVTRVVRPGVVCLPKGLWSHNTQSGTTSNALVPDTLTDIAGGACFNDARVQVERS